MTEATPSLKVVIAGGGTGGHVMPALAVAESLQNANCSVAWIGMASGPEQELVRTAGLNFYPIQAGKLRRYFDWTNVRDVFRAGIGFFQARAHLARLKPDIVFAKGGFVSLPVVFAAAFLEIPIVTHESDAVIGLANRLAWAKAVVVCTGFPVQSYPPGWRSKLRFTGNPVRTMFQPPSLERKSLLQRFDLAGNRPVILVFGGSQGAHAINQLIFDNLAKNLEAFQLIHLTGHDDWPAAEAARSNLPPLLAKRYRPHDFVTDELAHLLSLADLAVARAGANTLAELAALAKPTVLIPLPSAAGNHQSANAQAYADKDAAVVLDELTLTAPQLTTALVELLADRQRLGELAAAIRLFQAPKAAEQISEIIIEIAKNPPVLDDPALVSTPLI